MFGSWRIITWCRSHRRWRVMLETKIRHSRCLFFFKNQPLKQCENWDHWDQLVKYLKKILYQCPCRNSTCCFTNIFRACWIPRFAGEIHVDCEIHVDAQTMPSRLPLYRNWLSESASECISSYVYYIPIKCWWLKSHEIPNVDGLDVLRLQRT